MPTCTLTHMVGVILHHIHVLQGHIYLHSLEIPFSYSSTTDKKEMGVSKHSAASPCLSPDDVADDNQLDEAVHQSHFLVLDVHDLSRVILEHCRYDGGPGPHAALLALFLFSTHLVSPRTSSEPPSTNLGTS